MATVGIMRDLKQGLPAQLMQLRSMMSLTPTVPAAKRLKCPWGSSDAGIDGGVRLREARVEDLGLSLTPESRQIMDQHLHIESYDSASSLVQVT